MSYVISFSDMELKSLKHIGLQVTSPTYSIRNCPSDISSRDWSPKPFFPHLNHFNLAYLRFWNCKYMQKSYFSNKKQNQRKSGNRKFTHLLIWTKFTTRAGSPNTLDVEDSVQTFSSTTHSAIYWRFAMANHHLLWRVKWPNWFQVGTSWIQSMNMWSMIQVL